ncbi:MAG: hypothetical protein C5B48_12010 [Candidatus Rokuibacteriota bacterium]|nr:MAG: hypothetical protein C5B48_12010 [Candidatus Rokubacteria bacterium]
MIRMRCWLGNRGGRIDQRGSALPVAMLALLMLSALVVGLSVLGATEPSIAGNHLMVAQARALAEAGVERAIWALQTDNITSPIGGTAEPPYDGTQLIAVSINGAPVGGVRISVSNGDATHCPSAGDRCITAVGWVPSDTSAGPKAHQRIMVTASNPQRLFKNPPAALSVRGDLQTGDNSLVNSRLDTSCGRKAGTVSTGETTLHGAGADIRGATDDNDTSNEVTDAHGDLLMPNAHDIVKNLAGASFDQFAFADSDINFLRGYAKAHGTYLQGAVTFDGNNTIPNGLVFVDTVSGSNIAREGVIPSTPAADFATVSIRGNPAADAGGVWSGWLFVNGSLSIEGGAVLHGLVYTQNGLSYHGAATGEVHGAVIGGHIRDLSSGNSGSELLGGARITYNCAFAKTGGDTIPNSWTIKGGTYREPCDSCG